MRCPIPHDLGMRLSLNGQELQDGRTDDMIFDISLYRRIPVRD